MKKHARRKSDVCNKLQLILPLKPTNIPPTDVKVCVVDAMRILRFILICVCGDVTNS